jgi:hypothetical protein
MIQITKYLLLFARLWLAKDRERRGILRCGSVAANPPGFRAEIASFGSTHTDVPSSVNRARFPTPVSGYEKLKKNEEIKLTVGRPRVYLFSRLASHSAGTPSHSPLPARVSERLFGDWREMNLLGKTREKRPPSAVGREVGY